MSCYQRLASPSAPVCRPGSPGQTEPRWRRWLRCPDVAFAGRACGGVDRTRESALALAVLLSVPEGRQTGRGDTSAAVGPRTAPGAPTTETQQNRGALQIPAQSPPGASGHNSHRFNWQQIPADFSWGPRSPQACKMGTCSKSVTLSTCRISRRPTSRARRFLTIATST